MQEQTRATEQQEPLSGAQLQAIHKQYADAFKAALADVELRKLALDQACRVMGTTVAVQDGGTIKFTDPVALAQAMHAFLTAPAVEATKA